MIYNKSNENCAQFADSMDYERKMSIKLLPPSCLFCVNSSTNVKKFKISKNYDGMNTIRDDLINFLGYEIEGYLKDDDFLCSNCMNFFENMVIMKGNLIKFLKDRDESVDKKMKTFNDIWKMFTKFAGTLVKCNPNDTEETWDLEGITRSQTPNPMVFKYSELCNEEPLYKDKRCLSTAPSEPISEADIEVKKLLRKSEKRKKKGNNWTRRKGEQKSRALSRSYPYNAYMTSDCKRSYSADYRRARTISSTTCSELSRPPSTNRSATPRDRPRSQRKRRTVEGKPLRTRSVSRLEVLKANVMLSRESNKFYCSDLSCDLFFSNVDQLASHKVQDHGIVPRFSCSHCWKVYTTRNELEMHNKVHDTYTVNCFRCGIEIRGGENLQQHLKKHEEYSIECRYCHFAFLSKDALKQHCSREHQANERKRVYMKKSTVLKSVVNQNKIKGISVNNNNNVIEKHFIPRILVNSKPPEIPVDTSPIIVGSTVPDDSQVSCAITISDNSSYGKNSTSPVAISDVSSVIAFEEVTVCNMDITPTNQILDRFQKNLSYNNSPEVQTMLQEKIINTNIPTEHMNYIDCDASFESVSNIEIESVSSIHTDEIMDKECLSRQQTFPKH